jgi:hypothetical protein
VLRSLLLGLPLGPWPLHAAPRPPPQVRLSPARQNQSRHSQLKAWPLEASARRRRLWLSTVAAYVWLRLLCLSTGTGLALASAPAQAFSKPDKTEQTYSECAASKSSEPFFTRQSARALQRRPRRFESRCAAPVAARASTGPSSGGTSASQRIRPGHINTTVDDG